MELPQSLRGERRIDGQRRSRGVWRHILSALVLTAYLLGVVQGLRTLWTSWQAQRFAQRGIAFGRSELLPGVYTDASGVNVALEQYPDEAARERSLDLLVSAGFRWVRQRFSWQVIEPIRGEYCWEPWDQIIAACRRRGLRVIAVLDGSPDWARAPEDNGNPYAPPRNPGHYATFVRAFASRYGQAIDYYQIWDEPNISPHWGSRAVDPADYASLLRAARTQILDVDPGAKIILAGLAPTTETTEHNQDEVLYLRELYAAGADKLFDVVAAKPYGFWSGPEDRRVAHDVLNFSRIVLLREEMLRHGDAAKPIWAVAWGWNALPADWQGRPSPWGSDDPLKQCTRDLQAIARARQEWPWLGLLCYAAWQPMAPADDPVWGFSLLDARGEPGVLYDRLTAFVRDTSSLSLGYHTLPALPACPQTVDVHFWGTRLDLAIPLLDVSTQGRCRLLELDGQALQREIMPGAGWSTVAHGLALGEHSVRLCAETSSLVLLAVAREPTPLLSAPQIVLCLLLVALATLALYKLLKPYPWRHWMRRAVQWYVCLRVPLALALAGISFLVLAVVPNLLISLAVLAFLAALVAVRADVGLMLIVVAIPWAPLHKTFGPLRFSCLEIITLLTVAGQLRRELMAVAAWWWQGQRPDLSPSALWGRLRQADALDLGMVALVAASFLSLAASEWLHVSLRELRVVVLQAAFVYWLILRLRPGRAELFWLADLFVLSAVAICLHGLGQYLWTENVIVAEGVRRMRSIYGSPNNLALLLDRTLPLLLAVMLWGTGGRRRLLYAAAALLASICLFLTFSRAAWFLGLTAGLLTLALLAGRRGWLVAAGLAVAGLVALVPVMGTARFNSLLGLQGTTLLRVKLWEAAWEMARDHPLWGVGLDNFLYQYPRYIRPEALSEPNLSHPHNVLLDVWLRLGVPGLVVFIWLEWTFFRRAFSVWKRRADPALWSLGVGLLAGMVALLAHGLVDAALFVVELAAFWALMLGMMRRLADLVKH